MQLTTNAGLATSWTDLTTNLERRFGIQRQQSCFGLIESVRKVEETDVGTECVFERR